MIVGESLAIDPSIAHVQVPPLGPLNDHVITRSAKLVDFGQKPSEAKTIALTGRAHCPSKGGDLCLGAIPISKVFQSLDLMQTEDPQDALDFLG